MTKKMEMLLRELWAKHGPVLEIIRNAMESEFFGASRDVPHIDLETDLKDFDAFVQERLEFLRLCRESFSQGGNGNFLQSLTDAGDKITKKKYRKCFERRLHLVEFVAGSVLTTVNLVFQIFTPHRRIKWQLVCDKWNKEHPYDLMTPAVLKAEYYRAIREKDIHREYFSPVAEWMGPMRESILRLTGTDDIGELIKKKLTSPEEAFETLFRGIIKAEREAQNERLHSQKGKP